MRSIKTLYPINANLPSHLFTCATVITALREQSSMIPIFSKLVAELPYCPTRADPILRAAAAGDPYSMVILTPESVTRKALGRSMEEKTNSFPQPGNLLKGYSSWRHSNSGTRNSGVASGFQDRMGVFMAGKT